MKKLHKKRIKMPQNRIIFKEVQTHQNYIYKETFYLFRQDQSEKIETCDSI